MKAQFIQKNEIDDEFVSMTFITNFLLLHFGLMARESSTLTSGASLFIVRPESRNFFHEIIMSLKGE